MSRRAGTLDEFYIIHPEFGVIRIMLESDNEDLEVDIVVKGIGGNGEC